MSAFACAFMTCVTNRPDATSTGATSTTSLSVAGTKISETFSAIRKESSGY